MELLAQGDTHRADVAEEHVALYAQRLQRAAIGLDQVLVERGDEEGRGRCKPAAFQQPALGALAGARRKASST